MPTEINGYSPSQETALSSLVINEVDSNETFKKMKEKGILQDNQLYLVTDENSTAGGTEIFVGPEAPIDDSNVWIDTDAELSGGGVDIPASDTEPATGNYWLDTSAEGGTYYTAGEVDALLQNKADSSSVYKLVKLWENTNLSNAFAAQTLQIDFSEYDSVRIDFDYRTSVFISNLHGGTLSVDASFVNVESLNGKPYLYFASRRSTISSDLKSIYFDDGASCTCNNGTWGDLTIPTPHLKPSYIFGIKGMI